MPFTLTMPKMSPTMEEGTIAKWHKQVGDFVAANDLLFEVATDKATVEYYALDSGWLRQILIKDQGTALVNQPVAILTEEKDEKIEGYVPEGEMPKESAAEKPAAATEEKKQQPSPAKPKEEKAPLAPALLQNKPSSSFSLPPPPPSSPSVSTAVKGHERLKASPLARKLAEQKGLDLSSVQGSGPRGRIVSRDLEKARPLHDAKAAYPQPTEAAGSYVEEPLTPLRKVIAQRLQEAKATIPHFYVSLKVDAGPLVAIREQLKHHDVKLTYNDLIIRASALALRKHPNVNSGFNAAANTLVRFKTIDISVAVSIPGGLITPIVRHADFKPVSVIASEVKELVARAKAGKLDSHEYQGGSFTISNLGMYGVSDFIAIINPPQAAILAVSGVLETPVVRNGQIVPGHEMTLTLSGDHRVIDGVAAAEFLKTLQTLLENPAGLLV